VGFAEFAVNTILQPVVARLHALGEDDRLRRGIARVTLGGLAMTSVGAVVIATLASQILSQFGPEFRDATATVQILCISFVISAAAGQNGTILMMTGMAGDAARGTTVAVVLNVALNCVLVPSYGLVGAAWAWVATVTAWNALLAWRVVRTHGINATALGAVLALRR
jgi:O-antigen/teichoic acid export membrane protein